MIWILQDKDNSFHETEIKSPFAGETSGDLFFKYFLTVAGIGIPVFMLYLYLNSLITNSIPSIKQFGFGFLFSTKWDVIHTQFGGATFIYGTIITSLISILLGVPISVLAGIFIYEYVPKRLKNVLRSLIDVLAGIPSVIYGLWGIFILIPFLNKYIFSIFTNIFPDLTIVTGNTIFTAGIVLTIMITPILINIIMEGFDTVPNSLREAMFGLGATNWEVSKHVTIGTTKPTIFVAVMLGLGRALGETLAVTMVIGGNNNPPKFILDIFKPGQTISSLLANQFTEASGMFLSSLFEVALILFIITTIFNIIGLIILKQMKGELNLNLKLNFLSDRHNKKTEEKTIGVFNDDQ